MSLSNIYLFLLYLCCLSNQTSTTVTQNILGYVLPNMYAEKLITPPNLPNNTLVNKTRFKRNIHIKSNVSEINSTKSINFRENVLNLRISSPQNISTRPSQSATLLPYKLVKIILPIMPGTPNRVLNLNSLSSLPPDSVRKIMVFTFKLYKSPLIIAAGFTTDIYNASFFRKIDACLHHGWVKIEEMILKPGQHQTLQNIFGRQLNITDRDDFNPQNEIMPVYEVVVEYRKRKIKALFVDALNQYMLEPFSSDHIRQTIHIVKRGPRSRHYTNLNANISHKDYLINLETIPRESLKHARRYLTGPYVIEGVFYITPNNMDTPLYYLPFIASQVNSVFRHFSIQTNMQFQLKGIRNYPVSYIIPDQDRATIQNFIHSGLVDYSKMDVGILISNEISHNSWKAGYAYLFGMCTNSSLAVSLDCGFDTYRIIGHEIGHLFGCIHDMDNSCRSPSKRGIMHYSSTGFQRIIWSQCCTNVIHSSLRSGKAYCLENIQNNSPVKLFNPYNKRTLFDNQCSLTYGPMFFVDINNSTCDILFCSNITNSFSHDLPPLSGTYCDMDMTTHESVLTPQITGKVCMHGKCIAQRRIPVKQQGVWSPWGNWQPCQGFCPLGYQARYRFCQFNELGLNVEYCVGDHVEYKTCPHQCGLYQANYQSWNSFLCGQFYRGSFYYEYPTCDLWCISNNKFLLFNPSVTDGTIINGTAVCVGGTLINW